MFIILEVWHIPTLAFKSLKYVKEDQNLNYQWQNVRQYFASSIKAKYVTKNTFATIHHRLGSWLPSLTESDISRLFE